MSDNYKLKKNVVDIIEKQKKHFQKIDSVIAKTHDELNYYMNNFNGEETIDGLKSFKQYFEVYELCLQEIRDQLIYHDLDFMASTQDILFMCFKELFGKFLKFMNDFAMEDNSSLQFENKTYINQNYGAKRQSRMSINFGNKYEILEKAKFYLQGTQKELEEMRDEYEEKKHEIEQFINNKDYLTLEASQAEKQLMNFSKFNERKLGKLKQAIYQGEAESEFLIKNSKNFGDEAYDDLKQNMLIEFGEKYKLLFKKFKKYYVLKDSTPTQEMIHTAIQTDMYKSFQENIQTQTEPFLPDTTLLDKLKSQIITSFDKNKSLEDQLNDQKNLISSQIYKIIKKKNKIQLLKEKNLQNVEEINKLSNLNKKFQRDVHELNVKSQMLDNYSVNAQVEWANKMNSIKNNLLDKEEIALQKQQQLLQQSQQIQTSEDKLQKLTQQIVKQNATIESQIEMINELTSQLGQLQTNYENDSDELMKQIQMLKGDQSTQFENIFLKNEQEKQKLITNMNLIIEQKENENLDLINLRDQLAEQIQILNDELQQLMKKRDDEKKKFNQEIGALQQNKQELEKNLSIKEADLKKTEKLVQSLQSRSPKYSLAQHQFEIQELNQQISLFNQKIMNKDDLIGLREKKIQEYEDKINQMQNSVNDISREINLFGQLNINERENLIKIIDCVVIIKDTQERTKTISWLYQEVQEYLNNPNKINEDIIRKYQQSIDRQDKQIQTIESMMEQDMRKSKIKATNRFTNMILDNVKKTEMLTGPAMLVNNFGNLLKKVQKSESKKPIKLSFSKSEQKNVQKKNSSILMEKQYQKDIEVKQEEIYQIMNQSSQNEIQIILKKKQVQQIIEQGGEDENLLSQKQIEIQNMEKDISNIDQQILQKQQELQKIIEQSKNHKQLIFEDPEPQQENVVEDSNKYRDMNKLSQFYDKSVMELRIHKNQQFEEQIKLTTPKQNKKEPQQEISNEDNYRVINQYQEEQNIYNNKPIKEQFQLNTPKKKNISIDINEINNFQNLQLKESIIVHQHQQDLNYQILNKTPPKIKSSLNSRHSSAKTLRSLSAQSITQAQNNSPKSKQKVTFRKSVEKFLPQDQSKDQLLQYNSNSFKSSKNIITLDGINEKIELVNQHRRTSEYIYDQIKKIQQPININKKQSRKSLSNYQFISVNQRIARTSSVTELPEDYQVTLEQVHAYYITLVEAHQKCGKNCIHIKNFIENIGPLTTHQIKNNQLSLPKINNNN